MQNSKIIMLLQWPIILILNSLFLINAQSIYADVFSASATLSIIGILNKSVCTPVLLEYANEKSDIDLTCSTRIPFNKNNRWKRGLALPQILSLPTDGRFVFLSKDHENDEWWQMNKRRSSSSTASHVDELINFTIGL